MALNLLQTATIFQQTLDEALVLDACTGWMEANAGQVIYNGGAEVKIPKIAMDGLASYNRVTGYMQGAVNVQYGTYTLTQDRGRKFSIDAMDVDETNFVAVAGNVMGEFQRTMVVPEIDSYRITTLFGKVDTTMKKTGYTPAKATMLDEVKTGMTKVQEVYGGPLVCHITPTALTQIELKFADQLEDVTFSVGGVDTRVPGLDGMAFVKTPQSRMYTAITVNAGTERTGEEDYEGGFTANGGYAKGSGASDINFMIMPMMAPIAVAKQDKMKIFNPDQNQDADAWKMNYRKFHDIWVQDNKTKALYACTK